VSEAILSAGAVLWRPDAHGIELLLVHRPKYDDWSLPKGKREPGEHVLLTAAREVLEETSVRPVFGPRLRTVEYLAHGRPKQVDYWSALSTADEAAASHEIDAVSWLPLPQALGRLTYPHDADVIGSLQPRATVPLILVRHASAGYRDGWADQDRLRPLDTEGTMDASLLAELLACFAPRARVISSPALRCTESACPAAIPILIRTERTELRRSGTCSATSWPPVSPWSSACTERTCRSRSPPRPRCSARRRLRNRTCRCPRAASGFCTSPRANSSPGNATSS
jgi:8-oxo-dGTP pyrophosphatase MutT (NUDIX family)